MGIAIGAGIAAVGAVGSYMGSQASAQAAGDAAMAQQQQAEANRRTIMAYTDQWSAKVKSMADASPQELNILNQQYDAASKNLDQQNRLMASIDPALMEASKQAMALLQGGTAAANNPLMAQRNAQRAQLVNSLRAQHGPGAELSSFGQHVLSQFDMQTDAQFAQNQQNSLGQLMGIANYPYASLGMQRAISGLGEVGQGYGAIQQRGLNAELNVGNTTLNALSGSNSQLLQTAGAQYVGAGLAGQGMASLGNNMMQAGAMYGAMASRPTSPSPGGTTYNAGVNGMPSNSSGFAQMQQPTMGSSWNR